jgi:hypothetical protein
MLSIVILSVIMLRVIAPYEYHPFICLLLKRNKKIKKTKTLELLQSANRCFQPNSILSPVVSQFYLQFFQNFFFFTFYDSGGGHITVKPLFISLPRFFARWGWRRLPLKRTSSRPDPINLFGIWETRIAWFKSNFLLNIQIYNMSSLHKYN